LADHVPFVRADGSSPRLRGTLDPVQIALAELRFIPAPAGNAGRSRPIRPCRPVHPRACGERRLAFAVYRPEAGSSPRLRGTHDFGFESHGLSRFIPAPAGNASRCITSPGHKPVHPRACGERLHESQRSPRTHWFIPAPAGNATHSRLVITRSSVHPRACGERTIQEMLRDLEAGSSPRLRGTLACRVLPEALGRFIPAPAGNAS